MKEHRLSVFENRILGKIFEPSKDEITGGWEETRVEDSRSFMI